MNSLPFSVTSKTCFPSCASLRRTAFIDKFEFFNKNRDLWEDLKEGRVVEIPDELFPFLKGVAKVEDSAPKSETRGRKKKEVVEMNIEETTSLDDDD